MQLFILISLFDLIFLNNGYFVIYIIQVKKRASALFFT